MHEVVRRLRTIVSQSNTNTANTKIYQQPNKNFNEENNNHHNHHVQNFDKNTKEIESVQQQMTNKNISSEANFVLIVDKIVDNIFKLINGGSNEIGTKQHVIECLNNCNINVQEICNWISSNN